MMQGLASAFDAFRIDKKNSLVDTFSFKITPCVSMEEIRQDSNDAGACPCFDAFRIDKGFYKTER
jgi:hypothetical protein